MIDRIGPTRRPQQKPAGFQQWRSLLFLHWAVPVEQLRPLVPASLELDLHDGLAYVGIVPFAMQGVRPWWSPPAIAFRFLETNVRTYVVHDGQPGVYFFSLDAASRIAVWIARKFWGLPYFDADMRMQQEGDFMEYSSVRHHSPAELRLRYRVGEPLGPSQPDTIEFFFLERYLLFVERRNGICVGQVHHTPYPAQRAELLEIQDSLLAESGFSGCAERPEFVHYSAGVDVEIFDLKPV